MKVALLGPYPQDPERPLGGPETAVALLQAELSRLPGVTLHIITCVPGLRTPTTTSEGPVGITYLPRGRLGRVTWHIREMRRMLAALCRLQPDIVHAQGSGLYAGAALASPYPAVVTVHGILGEEARLHSAWSHRLRGLLDGAYERWVLRRTEHLIAISPYVERAFEGLFRGASYVVENPCDLGYFGLPRNPVPGRILLPGVVIPRKGVLPMLRALAIVQRALPEAHLHVAGSTQSRPDYYAACTDYVRQAGLTESVAFLGHLSRGEMREEYAAAATVVLPSFQETAPIAIAEAMAAGVPVVATRAGGVSDMVADGVTGRTLLAPAPPEGDPEALAEALIEMLSRPELAEAMGQRARAVAAERFRPDVVARRTYDVYRRVLGMEVGGS